MQDKLIPLCKLYENTGKTTGNRYFVSKLSFTAKLLILRNDEAKEGEPPWTLFLTEREQKPQAAATARNGEEIPDPGEPVGRRARTGGGGVPEPEPSLTTMFHLACRGYVLSHRRRALLRIKPGVSPWRKEMNHA
jgi:hypothetical protein